MKLEQKQWIKEKGWESISDNNLKEQAQIVFVFGTRQFLQDKKLFKDIIKFYPNAHIVGGSTAGEIIGTNVMDNSIVLTAVYFEKTELDFAEIEIDNAKESQKKGQELAKVLNKEGLKHVFVVSDGTVVNGNKLIVGMLSVFPEDITVTGGLAGDQTDFKETLVFLDKIKPKKAIIAVGFYGDNLKVNYGSVGGWQPFGVEREITKAEDNILYELDGKSALDLYKEYLGEEAKKLPASALLFPLSIKVGEKDEIVRTILSIDEKKGSMIFAGDMPEGAKARFMKATTDQLVDGAEQAANSAIQPQSNLALLVSCVGRKLVLKQRVEEEVEVVQEKLGKNTVITGFYSYGELCPIHPSKESRLHNQTMTITTFSEN